MLTRIEDEKIPRRCYQHLLFFKAVAGDVMLLKTILNRLLKFKSFVYGECGFTEDRTGIWIQVLARKNSKGVCSRCGTAGSCYDRLPERWYEHVPLWGLRTFLVYAPRRIGCVVCGVTVELVPWAVGKSQQTTIMKQFLAEWAKSLSWDEVARRFHTSWNRVQDAVGWVVAYGLKHRSLEGISAIGVDEVLSWHGHKYITLVYQIDADCKRLLWVAKSRTEESIRGFFDLLGKERSNSLNFVASDMWRAYLKVVKERAPQALHVLDRFHIVANLNKAVDQVRRDEARAMRQEGHEPMLAKSRWCWLKRKENLTDQQRITLRTLLQWNLKTVRAYLLRLDFENFWAYQSPTWAAKFLKSWTTRALRSRIEPMQAMARQLREHEPLILNWFRAKKDISAGVVEAMNNNAKVVMRKAYGFRTFETLEVALFHKLGALPEPAITHKFW